ncbi:hypothetical protein E3N88_44528 [Mikania micrantha]|uniref:Uncharacterized protein n=1 Tax=Mikania micrantha TaxID=192012 RepID=A0A5N6LE44_9ASTR|nr:hypothetical protein E3N88_44528 [Mikania micrantha]
MPKTHTFLPPLAAIKVADNPPEISLKTRPAPEVSVSQDVQIPPNVPDFDPKSPEQPKDPPPLPPNPGPEFPGPPVRDPEIQPPGPDMPVPPIPGPEIQPPGPDMPVPPSTPGGPEVVPQRTPEWMPPRPSEEGTGQTTAPEISLPYAAFV